MIFDISKNICFKGRCVDRNVSKLWEGAIYTKMYLGVKIYVWQGGMTVCHLGRGNGQGLLYWGRKCMKDIQNIHRGF